MKYIIVILILMGSVLQGVTQEQERGGPLEERIESQRVAFISQRMDLTPETAQKFWPIYNAYRVEEKKLQREKIARRRLEHMDDDQATDFIEKMMVKEQEQLDLKKALVSKLRGVVTPTQALRLFQAERAFKERLVQMLKRQRPKGR